MIRMASTTSAPLIWSRSAGSSGRSIITIPTIGATAPIRSTRRSPGACSPSCRRRNTDGDRTHIRLGGPVDPALLRPRWSTSVDHVEIEALDEQPLPITGYLSHFFGPVEPELTIEEVAEFVAKWLDEESGSDAWQAHLDNPGNCPSFRGADSPCPRVAFGIRPQVRPVPVALKPIDQETS